MSILFQAAWDFYLPWYAAKTPGFGFIFNAARNGLLSLNQSKLLEVLHVDKDSPIFQSFCLTKLYIKNPKNKTYLLNGMFCTFFFFTSILWIKIYSLSLPYDFVACRLCI